MFVISLIECPPTEECTILNISDLIFEQDKTLANASKVCL